MRHVLSAAETARVSSVASLFKPHVDELLIRVQAACEPHKYHLIVSEGRRDPKRQQELFTHGRRLVAGRWIVVDKAAILTNAPPGSSPHEYGLAVDILFYPDTTETIAAHPGPLEASHPAWDAYGAIVRELGLMWGGDFGKFSIGKRFRDCPHAELKDWLKYRT